MEQDRRVAGRGPHQRTFSWAWDKGSLEKFWRKQDKEYASGTLIPGIEANPGGRVSLQQLNTARRQRSNSEFDRLTQVGRANRWPYVPYPTRSACVVSL